MLGGHRPLLSPSLASHMFPSANEGCRIEIGSRFRVGKHGTRFCRRVLRSIRSVGPAVNRKTRQRYDEPGEARFLTYSCFRRQPFLADDRARHWFASAWCAAAAKHQFDLWAYVLMPEHVHLLVYARQPKHSVAKLLQSLNESVSVRAVNHWKTHDPAVLEQMEDRQPNGKVAYRFWQRGGGYDLNLWTPAKIWEHIDYMHANPVNRGLCDKPEDWLWSSAADFRGIRDGPLPLRHDHLPSDFRSPSLIAKLGDATN